MRTAGLQLEYLPPLRIPFRFFMSAPLFGVLGALLLLGAEDWVSRWQPQIMAATHLLTLGFMATVMLGALFQVLPVLGGGSIPGQRWLAPVIQLLVSAGTLILTGAFIWPEQGWQLAAAIILGAGILLFLGALGLRLMHFGKGGDSIFSIRLAALSLLFSVGLGITMLCVYMGVAIPPYLANMGVSHLRFALLGWVLLLIIGVSYQVVPMFFVTPDYPAYLRKTLPAGIFVALAALTFGQLTWLAVMASCVLIVAAVIYALVTLNLFVRRKRKISDYTIRFWQLGLCCLLLALLGYSGTVLNNSASSAASELWWGILMIPGFAISIVIGMLYKIAPFLSWLHLQQNCLTNPTTLAQLPTMHDLLPVKHARTQFWLHCLSLTLLLGAVQFPVVSPLAAIVLAADFLWLEISLLTAMRRYRNSLKPLS